MDRAELLDHLKRTRFAPGDRKQALADARRIASYLKSEYGAVVTGIGSLFESPRPFLRDSDIDLVVKDLPPECFYQACDEADALSGFDVELIPWESANELVRRIVEDRGVRL